jgi:hypothetical protein
MINYSLLNKLFKSPSSKKKWANMVNNVPTGEQPTVTQSDARDGYIYRYFVRPINNKKDIVEIDKSQYKSFKKNPLYVTAEVRWKIIGKLDTSISPSGAKNEGVRDINIRTVSGVDLTFGGLMDYIRDYTEFWVGETK